MKKIFFLSGVFLFFNLTTRAAAPLNQIKVDSQDRSYMMYVPANLPKEKVPLMIFLHGGFGSADHSYENIGFNEVADKNQFIVAYPNGTSIRAGRNFRVWNAGQCCGPAQKNNVNDVHFIEMMIKEIIQKYPVDPKRVYVSGMSNGAMMTYRLVCELPELITAAIPVSGVIEIDNCKAGQNIPLMHIHGTADASIQFNGGKSPRTGDIIHRSVPETMKIITQLRHCPEPKINKLSHGDTETRYECQEAPVILYTILNGEHTWPGGASWRNKIKNKGAFSASEEAWKFAKTFTKK